MIQKNGGRLGGAHVEDDPQSFWMVLSRGFWEIFGNGLDSIHYSMHTTFTPGMFGCLPLAIGLHWITHKNHKSALSTRCVPTRVIGRCKFQSQAWTATLQLPGVSTRLHMKSHHLQQKAIHLQFQAIHKHIIANINHFLPPNQPPNQIIVCFDPSKALAGLIGGTFTWLYLCCRLVCRCDLCFKVGTSWAWSQHAGVD